MLRNYITVNSHHFHQAIDFQCIYWMKSKFCILTKFGMAVFLIYRHFLLNDEINQQQQPINPPRQEKKKKIHVVHVQPLQSPLPNG